MSTSSFPPGRKSIVIFSAWFQVRKMTGYMLITMVIIFSVLLWRIALEEWPMLKLMILLGGVVITPPFFVFFVALTLKRAQKIYLRYKIQRCLDLQRTFNNLEQIEKLERRIDYFQQHLRAIDPKFEEKFALGTC